MNKLTERLVTETAKANKRKALENGSDFRHLVQCAHVEWLIAEYGWIFKQRAVDLFRLWRPEYYDGEFIKDYHRLGFDLDVRLSDKAMRCVWRKVARDVELQLTEAWGDLPVRVAQPQQNADLKVKKRSATKKKKAKVKKVRDRVGGTQLDMFGV